MRETNSSLAVEPAAKKRSKPAIKKENLPAELARLQSLGLPELKVKWAELYGKPLKGARRDFLIRGIAYRLQELVYGGLSAKTRRRLKQLAKQFARNPDHRPTVAPDLKSGCRLLREWRGVMHEVVVLEKGFRYRDQAYRTLSEVARLITGTRWSGPVFFGLKKVASSKERRQVPARQMEVRRGRKAPVSTAAGRGRHVQTTAEVKASEFVEPFGDAG